MPYKALLAFSAFMLPVYSKWTTGIGFYIQGSSKKYNLKHTFLPVTKLESLEIKKAPVRKREQPREDKVFKKTKKVKK
jgi:hypothetical protein